MVIVAGHLIVDPSERDTYVTSCVGVVEEARAAPGCLDFAITADPIDPGRVNVYERWESQAAVDAFRGRGPAEEQGAAILSGAVSEYEVSEERPLFDPDQT